MKKLNKHFFYSMLFLFIFPAWSLEEDANQPLHIQSDRFNLDYQSGLAVYEGSVQATQGSRRLWGDRLTVKSTPEGIILEINVTGNKAHYQYQPATEGTPAVAEALTIQYEPQKHLFTLIDEAQIERAGNVFKGPIITYNTETEIIDSSASKLGRSSMVLQPLSEPEK